MVQVIEKAAEQAPSLVVLTLLVYWVLKHLRARDKAFESITNRNRRVMVRFTEALAHNTDLLMRVEEKLDRMEARNRQSDA